MDAINEITIDKHQEFEKTANELISRLTKEKEDLTVKNQEQAKIINDTSVPPETAERLLKLYPDIVEGYFKILFNNDPSKIRKYHKKFTFPLSSHVKYAVKKFFKTRNSYPKSMFDQVLEFIRAYDKNNTEDPPQPRIEEK
jgi:hypothetical protein